MRQLANRLVSPVEKNAGWLKWIRLQRGRNACCFHKLFLICLLYRFIKKRLWLMWCDSMSENSPVSHLYSFNNNLAMTFLTRNNRAYCTWDDWRLTALCLYNFGVVYILQFRLSNVRICVWVSHCLSRHLMSCLSRVLRTSCVKVSVAFIF